MLYRLEKIVGMSICASDEEIGQVRDIYFDDYRWAIRYLVIGTGGWLDDRKVLISPFAIKLIDWVERKIYVRLTKSQIQGSPVVDTQMPVSRQHEMEFNNYYNYPYYWTGNALWGDGLFPIMPTEAVLTSETITTANEVAKGDPHLRSVQEVVGYHLKALDESIGHLEDFLIEEWSWLIRYIVVDTRNWWPGKHVVIPRNWVKELDWTEKMLIVDVTRALVHDAPEYDPTAEFSSAHEKMLYQYYKNPS